MKYLIGYQFTGPMFLGTGTIISLNHMNTMYTAKLDYKGSITEQLFTEEELDRCPEIPIKSEEKPPLTPLYKYRIGDRFQVLFGFCQVSEITGYKEDPTCSGKLAYTTKGQHGTGWEFEENLADSTCYKPLSTSQIVELQFRVGNKYVLRNVRNKQYGLIERIYDNGTMEVYFYNHDGNYRGSNIYPANGKWTDDSNYDLVAEYVNHVTDALNYSIGGTRCSQAEWLAGKLDSSSNQLSGFSTWSVPYHSLPKTPAQYIRYNGNVELSNNRKCDCGASSVRHATHAHWCSIVTK